MVVVLPSFTRTFCALAILAALSGNSVALELFGVRLFGQSEEPAVAEDALSYQASIDVTGDDSALSRRLKSGSLLISQQSTPPPSGTVGLVARARQDRRNLVGLLYQEGYYGTVVEIRISGQPLDSVGVTQSLATPVDVAISVEPGQLFRFGEVRISGADGIDTGPLAANAGLIAGEIARSDNVLKTETAIVQELGRQGHPYPRIAEREIVADHSQGLLDVSLSVSSGPTARFGPVSVEGAIDIDPDHIAFVADIPQGAPYSTEVLRRSKARLGKIEALASVNIRPADSVAPDGRVPVIIEISERKSRVIGAGASWSSTDGLNVNAYWKHRNLFGRGELFRVDIGAGRLTESGNIDQMDANLGILLSQPGFFGPATRFDTSLKALQEHPDAYLRRAVIAEALIAYQFSPALELTGGISGEYSDLEDAQGSAQYGLISLPMTAVYDSRDNRLNPAQGIRARALLEPAVDVLNSETFVKLDTSFATYYALDQDNRFVLAGRIGAGAIAGASQTAIPADRRFLAGGGGSVRGYGYKNIGAGRLNGDAVAGRSRIEGSTELRVQWTETIGAAIFADAGFVGDDPAFSGIGDFKVGVGGGLRYFTPVGPIRLDIGVPIDPDQDDPDFAIYVGIGQAF